MVCVAYPPWRLADALGLSWVEVHGAVTHFPVALLALAGTLELGAFVLRRPTWRVVSFWMLAGAVVSGLPAVTTGWVAAHQMFGPAAPPELSTHRLLGMLTVAASAVILAVRVAHKDRMPGLLLPTSAALLLLTTALVGLTGYLGGRMVFGGQAAGDGAARAARPSAVDAGQTVSLRDVERGAGLFTQAGCVSCHTVAGAGGHGGPDLSYEGARHGDIEWQLAHLRDPAQVRPGSVMPSFRRLSLGDLRSLAAYLATRR